LENDVVRLLLASALALAGAATTAAQQVTNPAADLALLWRAIPALRVQRNSALDHAAELTARPAIMSEELAKAQARVRELEAPAKAEAGK
jgi:hypothetical protein